MRLEEALDMVPEIIAQTRYRHHEDAIRKLAESANNYRNLSLKLRRELKRCQRQTRQ